MDYTEKYTILGYVFAFIGSTFFSQILIAAVLGLIGALIGWFFDRYIRKWLDKVFKQGKYNPIYIKENEDE
jgi:H+/Cl- antiporter ClcA